MRTPKKQLCLMAAAALAVVGSIIAMWGYLSGEPWGFARIIPKQEKLRRLAVVQAADGYLGCCESDGSHRKIIDLYNAHLPLARDYRVTYADSWCAAFVSAAAIETNSTDIIPTECSCGQQIKLLQSLDSWQERDAYIPLPGDLIYYDWDAPFHFGDCTGWPDHVGIVVGTLGPMIKVIEGNYSDRVAYRYVPVNSPRIRGYGVPNYG